MFLKFDKKTVLLFEDFLEFIMSIFLSNFKNIACFTMVYVWQLPRILLLKTKEYFIPPQDHPDRLIRVLKCSTDSSIDFLSVGASFRRNIEW